MKPIRKFLARHVWLLFLLVVACFVGLVTLVVKAPLFVFVLVIGAALGLLAYCGVALCFAITYHLYMRWSLE